MAKASVINREKRRTKLVLKYAAKRAELKKRGTDLNLSMDERFEALQELQKLPRDSSPVRGQTAADALAGPTGFIASLA